MEARTDELVNEVFALTKIKLSPDDPLLAVILLQDQSLKRTFENQNSDLSNQNKAFFAQLDERQIKIDAMYSELVQYRERVVAELLAKNQQIAVQVENRVQRKVLDRIQRLRQQIVVFLALAVLSLVGIGSMFLQMRV